MDLDAQRRLTPLPVEDAAEVVTVLNDLLTVVHDSLDGYRTVEEALEDDRYRALFEEYVQQ